MSEIVTHYLELLQKRRDTENAWDRLVELDDSYVPELIQAYWETDDLDLRASLVEIIWEHRVPETIDFLTGALQDDHPKIWKAALDGFFVMDINHALKALLEEKSRLSADLVKYRERLEWIDEAITQLQTPH